jgi:hypothetical protein
MTTKRKKLEELANDLPDYMVYRVIYQRGKGYRLERMDGVYGRDGWTFVAHFPTAAAGEDWFITARRRIRKKLAEVTF